jgi:hypothetical protein
MFFALLLSSLVSRIKETGTLYAISLHEHAKNRYSAGARVSLLDKHEEFHRFLPHKLRTSLEIKQSYNDP